MPTPIIKKRLKLMAPGSVRLILHEIASSPDAYTEEILRGNIHDAFDQIAWSLIEAGVTPNEALAWLSEQQ